MSASKRSLADFYSKGDNEEKERDRLAKVKKVVDQASESIA